MILFSVICVSGESMALESNISRGKYSDGFWFHAVGVLYTSGWKEQASFKEHPPRYIDKSVWENLEIVFCVHSLKLLTPLLLQFSASSNNEETKCFKLLEFSFVADVRKRKMEEEAKLRVWRNVDKIDKQT